MSNFENLLLEGREYVLNLPYHLSKAGMADDFCEILSDFEFLQYKISNSEVQLLIEDYDFIEQLYLLSNIQLDSKKIKILSLIKDCLKISSHILNEDKNQLIGQLWGRLSSF